MKVIEVVISPRGEATVRTKGFAGPECATASRPIEQALGMTASEQKTAEFYQAAPQQAEVQS